MNFFKKTQVHLNYFSILSIIILLLLAVSQLLSAQNYKTYFALSDHAHAHLKKGNADSCIIMYKEIFKKWEALPDECLYMAEAYLKTNNPKQAFVFFEKAVLKGVQLNNAAYHYKYCDTLKYASKWRQFVEHSYPKVRKKHLKTLDIDLYTQILTLHAVDNYVRLQYIENSKRDSALLWQLMDKIDTITLNAILGIIKTNKGYPSIQQIGDASDDFYLLLLHTTDEKTELDLMPILIKAIENGDLHPNQVAYLRDYHELGRTKTQIYGTLNPRFAPNTPIADLENVDKRRGELGLPTLERSYTEYKWALPKGYKALPK